MIRVIGEDSGRTNSGAESARILLDQVITTLNSVLRLPEDGFVFFGGSCLGSVLSLFSLRNCASGAAQRMGLDREAGITMLTLFFPQARLCEYNN